MTDREESALSQLYNQLRNLSPNKDAVPSRSDAIKLKREESKNRMESALATGADVISADSRLHNKNEILGNDEWNEALHFVSALGPITHKNWSLHLHIRRVAEFARRLSEELKGLNVSDFETLDPNTVRIQGLFHDIRIRR